MAKGAIYILKMIKINIVFGVRPPHECIHSDEMTHMDLMYTGAPDTLPYLLYIFIKPSITSGHLSFISVMESP